MESVSDRLLTFEEVVELCRDLGFSRHESTIRRAAKRYDLNGHGLRTVKIAGGRRVWLSDLVIWLHLEAKITVLPAQIKRRSPATNCTDLHESA